MIKFRKNKIEKEADYRENVNDHNISASKRKILDDIEKLVIQEEGKKRKIGRVSTFY